jgi:hypothetical protein
VVRDRITPGYFEAGHMMYIQLPSLVRLSTDVAGFIRIVDPGPIGRAAGPGSSWCDEPGPMPRFEAPERAS